MPLDPLLDLLLVRFQLVQCYQHKIAGPDPVQISQSFHKHVGQAVIGQNHIPVVSDRDSGGYNLRGMYALLFHAVHSGGDGGQCFPAALLPLKHSISLLQNTVDVLTLDVIKTNELLIFRVPQGKVKPPGSDLRVLRPLEEARDRFLGPHTPSLVRIWREMTRPTKSMCCSTRTCCSLVRIKSYFMEFPSFICRFSWDSYAA